MSVAKFEGWQTDAGERRDEVKEGQEEGEG